MQNPKQEPQPPQ